MLRFVLLFGIFTALFYALTLTSWAEERAWPAYLRLNARISGTLLDWLGQEVTAVDRSIVSSRFTLIIERGCDAVHPSALFAAAVLASPVTFFAAKLPGILLGTLLLMVTNLIRIVSLFFIRVHFPRAFEVMHVEVWQALFIFIALGLWAAWALWALRRRSHAGVPADA